MEGKAVAMMRANHNETFIFNLKNKLKYHINIQINPKTYT